MDNLEAYLKEIVEPTFDDFKRNPRSVRHAFLACVAAYHSIDRVTYPKSHANLRKSWKKNSVEFTIVDMVAHHFKHVKSDDERVRLARPGIPLSSLVFGDLGAGGQMDLHHLHFIVRDVVKFLYAQADVITAIKNNAPSAPRSRLRRTRE